MIASLRGKLIYTDNTSAVVECGGVGLRCTVTKNTLYRLPPKGSEVFLYTHLAVREDSLDLYGFESEAELNAFKLITSVNGVGAKLGIAILSEFEADRLTVYIASGDAKALTAASGVGIKLAQRIVLELKDKVGAIARRRRGYKGDRQRHGAHKLIRGGGGACVARVFAGRGIPCRGQARPNLVR